MSVVTAMAARFTEVTLEDMEKFLRRGFRALRPKKGDERREVFFDLFLSPNVQIRVWTSIGAGRDVGAEKGADAIRVQLRSNRLNRPLMKGKAPIVKRTQNWRTNLQKLIEDYVETYEEKEDYWEDRAGAPSTGRTEPAPEPPTSVPDAPRAPSAPSGGPPATPKQVGFAYAILISMSEGEWVQNWARKYRVDRTPTKQDLQGMSKKQISMLISELLDKGFRPPQRRYSSEELAEILQG